MKKLTCATKTRKSTFKVTPKFYSIQKRGLPSTSHVIKIKRNLISPIKVDEKAKLNLFCQHSARFADASLSHYRTKEPIELRNREYGELSNYLYLIIKLFTKHF